MRTGDSTRSSFTNSPPSRRPVMEDDYMDAGIDMTEETGNQSSPPLTLSSAQHKKLVRSHPKLTRAASKPESGSRQAGDTHNATIQQLRAFLQKRNSDIDVSTRVSPGQRCVAKLEPATPEELQKQSCGRVSPAFLTRGQGQINLVTQHPPDSLAILSTPYHQIDGPEPNTKVRTRLRGKVLKDRNSPIPKKGSFKKKSSPIDVSQMQGNLPSSAETSPCASPRTTNVLNSESSLSEEMETTESAFDSAVSSVSQISALQESASATSSLQSLPPAHQTFSQHMPVMHAASWPTHPAVEVGNDPHAFAPKLAQQVATLTGHQEQPPLHKPVHRTVAHPVPWVGIPAQHMKPVTVVSPPKPDSSHPPALIPTDPMQLGIHRPLRCSHSAPLPGQLPQPNNNNSLELQFHLQSLRAQFEVQQREMLRQYQMEQRELAAIQMKGEEQLRMQLLQLETTFRRRELMLAQEHELKQRQMQMRQSLGKDASYTASEQGVRGETPAPEGTGIAYDASMLKHDCTCNGIGTHHEHPGRLQSVYARLQETGVLDRCVKLKSRKASIDELQLVHSENHVTLYSSPMMQKQQLERKASGGGGCRPPTNPLKSLRLLPCGGYGVDDDTVWNDAFTSPAARIAAGCTIDLTLKVANGDLKNGFAVVRPPGHHAEPQQAMGFCYFNNVAIATKTVLAQTDVSRIAIIDWDVHHGNGTQRVFLDSPDVLYLSIHRHDDGTFFPGTGSIDECGVGTGLGMTVNIPFNGGINPPCGDPEYLAAFRVIVMPILREFQPEMIIVSAGFDACMGHAPNLGGYMVTPECFGFMTEQLMSVCGGRVVMALEGGYELRAICACSEACMKTLLGEEIPSIPLDHLRAKPHDKAVQVLEQCRLIQSRFWNSLHLPCHINMSVLEADQREREADTVQALQALSMASSHPGSGDTKPSPVQSRH